MFSSIDPVGRKRMNETTRPNVPAGVASVAATALAGGAMNRAGTGSRNGSTSESAAAADVAAKTRDFPINSRTAFADKVVVMTQPRSGEFTVFNS
jgi:hypothetical protein